ncbi:MAG: SHOCT-like domain-containing protein, partial [Ardenticatenaceae bacterium]
MPQNRRRILEMVAQGKIGVDDAERLLSLLEQAGETPIEPS